MKSPASLILATALAFLSTTANAAGPSYIPSLEGAYIGCFKPGGGDFKSDSLKEQYNSSGRCRDICKVQGTKYSATTKKFYCYCGDTLPPESDQVNNDRCNLPCAGFDTEPCGSNSGHLTIFLTDPSDVDDRLYDPDKVIEEKPETSTTSTTSAPTSTVTKQETSTVMPAPEETTEATEEKQEPSGINKAGAAAGAVVGVLVAIAIGVGAFLFIRKQRRRKVEEEYRRSLAVREYQKKPSADLRLDPVMLQRRMSDGSIADNQDYSRRILKVTNPDGM